MTQVKPGTGICLNQPVFPKSRFFPTHAVSFFPTHAFLFPDASPFPDFRRLFPSLVFCFSRLTLLFPDPRLFFLTHAFSFSRLTLQPRPLLDPTVDHTEGDPKGLRRVALHWPGDAGFPGFCMVLQSSGAGLAVCVSGFISHHAGQGWAGAGGLGVGLGWEAAGRG